MSWSQSLYRSSPDPRWARGGWSTENLFKMGRPTLTKANQKWWGASRPTIFDDFCQGWVAHFQTGFALEGLRYNPRGVLGYNPLPPTPRNCHKMALELVSGADFWCKLMCRARPVDLRGSRGRFSAQNPGKPARQFLARLPSGTQPRPCSRVTSQPPTPPGL